MVQHFIILIIFYFQKEASQQCLSKGLSFYRLWFVKLDYLPCPRLSDHASSMSSSVIAVSRHCHDQTSSILLI